MSVPAEHIPAALKKQQKVVDAIEKKLRGAVEAIKQPDPAPAPQPQPAPEPEPDPEPAPAPAVDPRETVDYWRQQASINDGRLRAERERWNSEREQLNARLREVEDRVAAAARSTPEEIDLAQWFTAEQIAEEGEKELRLRIAASRAAAAQEVEGRLKPVNDKLVSQEQSVREQKTAAFHAGLTSIVPNWREINADPAFSTWLDTVDELSGQSLRALGNAAMAAQDIARSAAFFKRFEREQSAGKAPARDPSRRAIPSGQPSSPQLPEATPQHTRASVSDFYKKLERARRTGNWSAWKGGEKEAASIETQIQEAVASGKLR